MSEDKTRPSPARGEGTAAVHPLPSPPPSRGREKTAFESRVLTYFIAAGIVVALLTAATWKLSLDAERAALRISHTH